MKHSSGSAHRLLLSSAISLIRSDRYYCMYKEPHLIPRGVVIFVEKTDYKLQGKFLYNITKVNKAIFNLKMSIFGTGLLATKILLA